MSFLLPPINIPSPSPYYNPDDPARNNDPEVSITYGPDLSNFFGSDTQDSNSADSDDNSLSSGSLTDDPSSADSDKRFSEDDFSNKYRDTVDWLNEQVKLWREAYETEQASADKAMEFEAAQAQLNRDWQEKMSNTSYQRAVADMKAAGINPLLAFGLMNGASTPSGATASGHSANYSASNLSSYYNSVISWYNNNTTAAAGLLKAIAQFLGNILG